MTTVEDLLLLSRVGDPDADDRFAAVDLRSVVIGVRDLTAPAVRSAGQRLDLRLTEDPAMVRGDAQQLDRAVADLVTNGVKYGREGSAVSLAVEVRGDELVVSCTDEGIGISPSEQESVFRPFFRSESPHVRSRPGTGLGLAIVERITTRHAGRIELDSTVGEGSTFSLVLLKGSP